MLGVQPQSVLPATLESLQARVKTLSDAIVDSLDQSQSHADFERAKLNLELALRDTKEYARFLQAAAHLQHLNVNARGFDDHDQVSSMLLYLVTQFERWKTASGGQSPRILRTRVIPFWGEANRSKAMDFDKGNPLSATGIAPPKIGILTVLEQEYQSVVRRLDEIVACTDDSSCGFGILDRIRPTDDMKDTSRPLGDALKMMGWTSGYVGSTAVVVVCTGYAGRERASECKREAERQFGITKGGWLVVGICAGSDGKWPIGSVLVSDRMVCSMNDPSPLKYVCERTFAPAAFQGFSAKYLSMERLFRRTPNGLRKGVTGANPSKVPVHAVKFACTRDVINVGAARKAIQRCLIEAGHLAKGEEFGIEMEGPGVAVYRDPMMCIVKGVCDYADERKQDWKRDHTQVLFQLYAAETAADFVVQAIRASGSAGKHAGGGRASRARRRVAKRQW